MHALIHRSHLGGFFLACLGSFGVVYALELIAACKGRTVCVEGSKASSAASGRPQCGLDCVGRSSMLCAAHTACTRGLGALCWIGVRQLACVDDLPFENLDAALGLDSRSYNSFYRCFVLDAGNNLFRQGVATALPIAGSCARMTQAVAGEAAAQHIWRLVVVDPHWLYEALATCLTLTGELGILAEVLAGPLPSEGPLVAEGRYRLLLCHSAT